jgi:hypothetical protein
MPCNLREKVRVDYLKMNNGQEEEKTSDKGQVHESDVDNDGKVIRKMIGSGKN